MEMPENYPNLTGQENDQPNFEELKPKNVPLAPIYKLALDNLLEIFAASCDKNMLTRERFCPSLALSAVCRTWRDIMLSTPDLWSSIEVIYRSSEWPSSIGSPSDFRDLLIQRVHLFMDRSKTIPLDLSVYITDWDVPGPGARCVWSLLSGNSERWRSLRLAVPRATLLMDIPLEVVAGRLASLKYLALSVGENADVPVTAPFGLPVRFFRTCPSLDTIVLENVNPDNLVFPYPQIKSLTLRDNTVGESFLTLFPTLEEVVLWDSRYPFHPAQQRTSLSQIRKLKIKTWKTDPDDDFFDPLRALTFPKLSSLHISYLNVMSLDDNSRKPFDEQALTSFLTHSQCFITELVLECAPISDVQTIRLIKLMPTLRSLHIEECPSPNGVPKNMVITSTFLKAISVTTEMAPLAPSLSELTLVLHPSAMGFDCQELVEALSSRRLRISTTVHGLSSANIGFIGPEEANPCIMQQLSTVRAGGKFGGGLNMRIRWVR